MSDTYSQRQYATRCAWGLHGLEAILPTSDAVVIVDVLSFSTCVDIACNRSATILPYRYRDERAAAYAKANNALLATTDKRAVQHYSLSPASLTKIPADTRLVLPSPNGATLSLATGATPTFAACFRNASAVAGAARRHGERIAVIPAGERWRADGSLRPALEDQLGAGAVIHNLQGSKSPEAQAAELAYMHFRDRLTDVLRQIGSGIELIEQGFTEDVHLAAQLNISSCVPRLTDRAYRAT